MNKILLHVCCGPCASGSIPKIEGWDITLYFTNSNINSNEEFEKRFDAALTVSEYYRNPIIRDSYEHSKWLEYIKGLESEPEKGKRCFKCFEFSFIQAAIKAKELGIPYFTSTLTISPHKNSFKIIEIGERIAKEYGLTYLSMDFCKDNGFKNSVDISKELGIYRQKYCGCEFSIWF